MPTLCIVRLTSLLENLNSVPIHILSLLTLALVQLGLIPVACRGPHTSWKLGIHVPVPQVAALAHDPRAMDEAREAVAEADETLAMAKQQVAALEAETKPLEQVRWSQIPTEGADREH